MAINVYKQQGVVLIVSLVFLAALTAVAAVMLQNSSTDMKMSGASQEKMVATEEVLSATNELVFRQVNKIDGQNAFSLPEANYPINNIAINNIANATPVISLANATAIEVGCPAKKNGTANTNIACQRFRVVVTKTYGKNNTSSVVMNTAISQQFIKP